MNIYSHTPYTYLIGWSSLNKWYYGVRYSRKCHPGDLWSTYFTSSKRVKQLRLEYGEPDIIEVRKIFKDDQSARLWEEKVLKRLDVLNNDHWLNANIAGAIAPHKAGAKLKGRKRSPEAIAKAIETRKKNTKALTNKGKKIPAISKALKGKPSSHKGKKHGPAKPESIQKMLESRKRYYDNGGIGPNKGKAMSEEQKIKIGTTSKGHKKSPSHCEKLSAIAKTRYKIKKDDGTWTWGHKT